jgi:bacterioferritin-associated ferredoxin
MAVASMLFVLTTEGCDMVPLIVKTGFIIFRTAMYVCVCLAVTEAEVDAAIAAGAVTRGAVTSACRAGGDCGACHGMIEMKIEDHLEDLEARAACPLAHGTAEESGPQLISAEALVRIRAA